MCLILSVDHLHAIVVRAVVIKKSKLALERRFPFVENELDEDVLLEC